MQHSRHTGTYYDSREHVSFIIHSNPGNLNLNHPETMPFLSNRRVSFLFSWSHRSVPRTDVAFTMRSAIVWCMGPVAVLGGGLLHHIGSYMGSPLLPSPIKCAETASLVCSRVPALEADRCTTCESVIANYVGLPRRMADHLVRGDAPIIVTYQLYVGCSMLPLLATMLLPWAVHRGSYFIATMLRLQLAPTMKRNQPRFWGSTQPYASHIPSSIWKTYEDQGMEAVPHYSLLDSEVPHSYIETTHPTKWWGGTRRLFWGRAIDLICRPCKHRIYRTIRPITWIINLAWRPTLHNAPVTKS